MVQKSQTIQWLCFSKNEGRVCLKWDPFIERDSECGMNQIWKDLDGHEIVLIHQLFSLFRWCESCCGGVNGERVLKHPENYDIEMRYQKLHCKTKLLTKSHVERLSKMVSTHLWNTSPLPIGQWYWCIVVCEVGGIFFAENDVESVASSQLTLLTVRGSNSNFQHLYVHPT